MPGTRVSHPGPACCDGQHGSAKPMGSSGHRLPCLCPWKHARAEPPARHTGTLRRPFPASESCFDVGHQPMRIPASWKRVQRDNIEESTSVSADAPGIHATKWAWQPHGPPLDSVLWPKELDVRETGDNRVDAGRERPAFPWHLM